MAMHAGTEWMKEKVEAIDQDTGAKSLIPKIAVPRW